MKSSIKLTVAIASLLSTASAVTPAECENSDVSIAKAAKEQTDLLLQQASTALSFS